MPFHPILRFYVRSSSEASQLHEIQDLAFAAYIRNLSSTIYHFQFNSINLTIHTISVYWDSVKFPSLSEWASHFSRSLDINDLDNPVDRKWVKFICLSSNEFVFSRSIRRQWSRQSRRSNVDRVHYSLLEWIYIFEISHREWSRQTHPSKWVTFICLSSNESLFSRSIVVNGLLTLVDQSGSSFPSLPSTDCVFSRSIVQIIRKVPSMESEWNSLLSPWITSLPFPDLRSRMACTIPAIENNWNSLLSSSDKSLSFPDQSSQMFWPILLIVSKWNFLLSPLTKSLFSKSTLVLN